MISPRWFCVAACFLGIPGCGSGSADASKDPSAAPAIQARTDQIARYKAQAGKPGRPPAAAPRKPIPRS